jgi:FkbM family methyltransferase
MLQTFTPDTWRMFRGVVRSLRIYHGNWVDRAAMDRLYGQFVRPGDLVFDIGAHVGDRVASFRRLGARVIAVEPQPSLVRTLKLLYGLDREVKVEPVAIGAHTGEIALNLNLNNPTVSTASAAFVRASAGAPGWEGQAWIKTIQVPMTTVDELIARHGNPSFIKIDVEGFEAETLAGLSRPAPALSFEFTTIQPDVAAACLARCQALGYSRYNAVLGEGRNLVHPAWIETPDIATWLSGLPLDANSGDIYARLG